MSSFQTINIGIYGATGKVGREIVNSLTLYPQCHLYRGVSSNVSDDDIEDLCDKSDVIIDFSTPTATMNLLQKAIKKNTTIVIGTTGYSKDQYQYIIDASNQIPIFYSANMSIGMNLMTELTKLLDAKLPKPTSIHITESHHQNKKDTPSGTALMLQEIFTTTKPTIHSIRSGNIPGKHEINFKLGDELLTIAHTSTSRQVYADGAIKAAIFMDTINNPGLYGMTNLK